MIGRAEGVEPMGSGLQYSKNKGRVEPTGSGRANGVRPSIVVLQRI